MILMRKSIKKFLNSDGVTLVELLASIVLITLILTAFITIFIQSAKTYKTSENIIDATYLAQTEMEKVYSASVKTKYSNREDAVVKLGYAKRPDSGDWFVFEKNMESAGVILRLRLQQRQIKPNMNRVIVEVLEGPDRSLQAKMENILLWEADAP